MSDDTTTADAVAFAQSIFINNCCGYTALALLFYEYAVTLDREVNLFWTRRPTGASVLFFVNRYTPLLLQIVDLCGYANMSDRRYLYAHFHFMTYNDVTSIRSCAALTDIAQTIQILQYVPWAVFSGLRVYALSGRNAFLGLTTFLLSAVTIALNLPVIDVCPPSSLTPDITNVFVVVITSRTCLIAADLIAIAVTWAATYRVRTLSLTQSLGHSFSAILLEYGMIYFIILTTLNVLHLTFTLLSLASDSISSVSYVTVFTEPITAILISRFLFNLQEANQGPGRGSALSDSESSPQGTSGSRVDTLIFARVVGPLGSPLVSRGDTTYPEEHSMKSVVDADTTREP
ncbi:hypothetical protein C8Q78DRAFT_1084002 [Trametes maxima]|nr:hypothetical protein C8Q78DRAFT_1084002 [Trametes maxima]